MSIPFKFNSLGISGKFRKPLKLTATQDSSSVKLTKAGNPNVSGLKYRVNSSNWQSYLIDTLIELNEGDYVEFININSTISTSSSDYVQFVMTGKIAASGNIQSLLNYSKSCSSYCFNYMFYECTSLYDASKLQLPATTLAHSCYYRMFNGCSNLTRAPELPATTLVINCYGAMFGSCTSLTEAPELPATTLVINCYNWMFNGCSNLTRAPELPATTLATSCYTNMFRGCTSLVNPPALPATTLANDCYYSMFEGCTSLINAPELPATTLAVNCYNSMFKGCTSLSSAPELPATTLAVNCYQNMFRSCTSLTAAPHILPALFLTSYCYSAMFMGCTSLVNAPVISATSVNYQSCSLMFNGCTSLVTAPALSAMNIAATCYSSMFAGCTSLINPPELPATSLATSCYNSMFYGCTALVNAPELPATTLASYCYSQMFRYCSSLSAIKVSFTAWNDSLNATNYWLQGVSNTGLFVKSSTLIAEYGENRIPTGWNVESDIYLLNYIESTGTQYINTGVKPNFPNNDEIYISFYGAEYSGSSPTIFGSRQSDLRNGVYGLGGNVTVLDADGYTSHAFDLVGDRWVKMDNSKVTSNGRHYEYALTRHPNCTYNIYLFALNNGGNTYGIYNGMKLYEWKYYQNGELKQWLIPVLDSNSVPCLYDKVSGTFKYNAGTGNFNYN